MNINMMYSFTRRKEELIETILSEEYDDERDVDQLTYLEDEQR